ncbi:MAG: transporter, partial [Rubrivivax sp.]|nr:transporter [Rubrivivax sp.]
LAVWMFGVAAASVLVMRGDLWRADLASLSPVPAPLLALDRELRADLGHGDSGTLVVVQGADVQATLQAAEAASARLEALIDSGVIAGFDSVTRFVPSLATQRQRQAALPEPAALEAALEAATEGGPLPAARLQGFLADVQAARTQALVQPQSLAGQPVAPLVDALLMRRTDGSAAALLPLQAGARDIDPAAVQKALDGLPQAQVLDIGQELSQLYRRYLGEAQGQALLGAAAVVVLMALALRSPRRLLAVCQPLALAVLLTLGGLAALGQSLGILHLVGLLLVVAVGSNYALFFDSAGGAADDDTLASLLLANLTTVASFGLLAMSSIPVLAAIGQVVAPGALLALVLAAVFAPRRPGDGPVKKSSA